MYFCPMKEKKHLRKAILEKKSSLTPEERKKQSERLCQRVTEHKSYIDAKTIMLFYPLEDEIDVKPLLGLALGTKKVLLPLVQGEDIVACEYLGEESLTQGSYGIMEPSLDYVFTHLDEIDLVLVPGIAFTVDGRRLGRGRGYYDRFLPLLSKAYKIGVCYDFQLVEDLPTEPHDILLDTVITSL